MLHVLQQINTCAVIYCFGEENHCLSRGEVWRYLKTIDKYDVPWYGMCQPPYVLLLAASKVFDRVCCNELFTMLIKLNVSPFVIRFLLFMYTNQSMRVKWKKSLSDNLSIGNGVRQGAESQPTRVQDLSAVNVTSQSQADRVNRNAYRYSVVILVFIHLQMKTTKQSYYNDTYIIGDICYMQT